MSLDERLRDHFDTAAQRLPDPGDSLAEVTRRGGRRGAVKAAPSR